MMNWPETAIILGIMLAALILIGGAMSIYLELRKAKMVADHEEGLRQLVSRYERLAEDSLNVQTRTASDVADMKSRTASIEKILRTVD